MSKEIEKGVKYDGEKPQMYLLPPLSTLEVGKVLTYGATKYSPDNWRKVPELQDRYSSAAMRHMLASLSGEIFDEETGIDHLAHAICCLMFKLEDRLLESQKERRGESDGAKPEESRSFAVSKGRKYTPYNEKRSVPNAEYQLQHSTLDKDSRAT